MFTWSPVELVLLPRNQVSWQFAGKTVFVPRSFRSPPSGSFEQLHLDFIQLPPSLDYQYVLVVVYFSDGLKPFPVVIRLMLSCGQRNS